MRLKSKWIILFGILAIVCGFSLLIFTHISVNNFKKQSAQILLQIEEIMPEKTMGAVDDYSSIQMPAIEISGEDIIGVIEFEPFNLSLPIGSKWEKSKNISYPKKFSGSVYDNSLVIGGYYCEGQFDILKRLNIGNRIIVTDMTGAQFNYEVKDIKRKKSAEIDFLTDETADLTLFVRDSKSLEYIIVKSVNAGNS